MVLVHVTHGVNTRWLWQLRGLLRFFSFFFRNIETIEKSLASRNWPRFWGEGNVINLEHRMSSFIHVKRRSFSAWERAGGNWKLTWVIFIRWKKIIQTINLIFLHFVTTPLCHNGNLDGKLLHCYANLVSSVIQFENSEFTNCQRIAWKSDYQESENWAFLGKFSRIFVRWKKQHFKLLNFLWKQ